MEPAAARTAAAAWAAITADLVEDHNTLIGEIMDMQVESR
jgi:hypothetical protein